MFPRNHDALFKLWYTSKQAITTRIFPTNCCHRYYASNKTIKNKKQKTRPTEVGDPVDLTILFELNDHQEKIMSPEICALTFLTSKRVFITYSILLMFLSRLLHTDQALSTTKAKTYYGIIEIYLCVWIWLLQRRLKG